MVISNNKEQLHQKKKKKIVYDERKLNLKTFLLKIFNNHYSQKLSLMYVIHVYMCCMNNYVVS